MKQAQADSDLYWCNYDDVIASYEIARRRALREGRELRFQGWDGTGKVTVRYQQGLPVAGSARERTGDCSSTRWTRWHGAARGAASGGKLARSRVRIRVGSEGREPVWLELPVVFHRPLPGGWDDSQRFGDL